MTRIVLFLALLVGIGSGLRAGTIYPITVNTSSIAGTAGSLDFQFNPGPNTTQLAFLQIFGFTSNGTLNGSPALIGDVTGTLPGSVVFDNATGFNDYFVGFTFGTTLSFNAYLYGPAVTSPDGISTSGSLFAFSMFSDVGGTVAALTSDPNGFAATLAINLNGSTSPAAISPQTVIGAAVITPEPGSLALSGIAIFLVGACFRRRL